MISDWVFQRVFFPVFLCFRKAIRNKIASHCAGQSRVMEVLMKTQQQRWWEVERPKLTTKGFRQIRSCSCGSGDIYKDKEKQPIARAPPPYLSSGTGKPSVWALKGPEPNGLVGDGEQGVGDGAASSSPPALPSALPSPLTAWKLWVGEQMKQEIGNTIPLKSKAKIWG